MYAPTMLLCANHVINGKYISQLELNDDSKTPVAQGLRSNAGIIGHPRHARLEIYPGFEHLADIIVITYIYMERRRNRQYH
jgi:hypothetical protein